MNVKQTVNISTNIHNERIKTKYIPSYIFENESKIFKKFNGAMHKLLVGECLTGAKSVRKQKCFGLYLLKQGR